MSDEGLNVSLQRDGTMLTVFVEGVAVKTYELPAEGYKLGKLVVNGVNITDRVVDHKVAIGYAGSVATYTVDEIEFLEDRSTYNVTFVADSKWGADGLVITLTKDGETKTVTLGDESANTVSAMEVGDWSASTRIGNMPVDLGTLQISTDRYEIDFSKVFGKAVTGGALANGTFVYDTQNKQPVVKFNVEVTGINISSQNSSLILRRICKPCSTAQSIISVLTHGSK